LTLNTLEFPSAAVESSLSDILETGDVPQRYYLSATACRGILRRAANRGKDLPTTLRQALQAVAEESNGVGVLRQALSEIQEIWRPVDVQTKPAYPAMQVRRLTPKEAERLQGLPDGHTQVPYHGKPMADEPRYKMIGNGFAIPCVRWIGERIQMVEDMNL
jgi:site-specific DNA-cytosine methylase